MKAYCLCLLLSLGALSLMAQPILDIVPFATGLSSAVDISNAEDSRLFIVERAGRIKIVDSSGTLNSIPFLDITGRVLSGGERGLLGLAFHPNYKNNGYFYVNYTDVVGDTRVSRFTVSANPDTAITASEVIVLTVAQPFGNHNGGGLVFGPNGYLYIGLGDGGSGGDPGDRAQNPMNMLGKMLRIDVDTSASYLIPADNPFVGVVDTLDEIWATGLRNPWRYSFDRLTGDLWIADVGQNDWEEVDFQPATSKGGENYGWRCYEGDVVYDFTNCSGATSFITPIQVYPHGAGVCYSITGGFVYRGTDHPHLQGHYVYGEYCIGTLWTLFRDSVGGTSLIDHGDFTAFSHSTFGEDQNGEMYLAGLNNGIIYQIVDICSDLSFTITAKGDTLSIGGNSIVYQWYLNGDSIIGATDSFYVATQSGAYTVYVDNGNGCASLSDVYDHVWSSTGNTHKPQLAAELYPNPFDTELSLELGNSQGYEYQVRVINITGMQVLSTIKLTGNFLRLPVNNLAPGFYMVELKGPGVLKHFKAVKN